MLCELSSVWNVSVSTVRVSVMRGFIVYMYVGWNNILQMMKKFVIFCGTYMSGSTVVLPILVNKNILQIF